MSIINKLLLDIKDYSKYKPNELYYHLLNKRLKDILYRYEEELDKAYLEIDKLLENKNIFNVVKRVIK